MGISGCSANGIEQALRLCAMGLPDIFSAGSRRELDLYGGEGASGA